MERSERFIGLNPSDTGGLLARSDLMREGHRRIRGIPMQRFMLAGCAWEGKGVVLRSSLSGPRHHVAGNGIQVCRGGRASTQKLGYGGRDLYEITAKFHRHSMRPRKTSCIRESLHLTLTGWCPSRGVPCCAVNHGLQPIPSYCLRWTAASLMHRSHGCSYSETR